MPKVQPKKQEEEQKGRGKNRNQAPKQEDKKQEKKQPPAKKENRDVSTNVTPIDIFFKDQGRGMEGLQVDDLAIPFLGIIQNNSPQKNPNKDKYIEGAEEGHIFNTLNNDLYSSVTVIPVMYNKVWVEWRDREEGGGFVGVHERNSPALENAIFNEDGKMVSAEGNPIVETAQFYVLIVDDESPILTRAIIAMKSTQLKKARKWNTLSSEIKMKHPQSGSLFTPPLYSHIYELGSQYEDNDKGDWYGWTIDIVGPIEDMDMLNQARAYFDSIQGGGEVINYEHSDLSPDMDVVNEENEENNEDDTEDGDDLY